ncbi:hypothetical protein C2G38_2047307 [Gigaspora rosea]|uniref:Uncharacterized protein n=1 Tax=Gigaspora rosea TaxID=44941 RepID=A0A397U9S4_9GLOM|nr:hypothetical protein C2G38_2047307 [Gigaspora rosea]
MTHDNAHLQNQVSKSTQEVFNEYLTDDEFIHIIYVEKSVNETNNANNPNDVVNEKNDNNNLQKYQIEEETRLLETKLNKSINKSDLERYYNVIQKTYSILQEVFSSNKIDTLQLAGLCNEIKEVCEGSEVDSNITTEHSPDEIVLGWSIPKVPCTTGSKGSVYKYECCDCLTL